MILNNFKKFERKRIYEKNFDFKLPETGDKHKNTYVAFFPWCKNDASIFFFSVSKAFLKEYPVILILNPEVWTEEMKLFASHISYSSKL